jgi:hypothetical protein
MENYTYIQQNNKYQLYRKISHGHTSEFIVFKKQYELAKALKEEYNAEIRPIEGYDSIYQVWFDNLIDLNRTIEYLNALDTMRQLIK